MCTQVQRLHVCEGCGAILTRYDIAATTVKEECSKAKENKRCEITPRTDIIFCDPDECEGCLKKMGDQGVKRKRCVTDIGASDDEP
ncbi:hypothetical protein FPOAC2_07740 [Fusarium poae]|jgi:hypothetical protein